MTNLIRLRVPPGASDGYISHGTDRYWPWREDINDPESDEYVDVKPEAVAHFIERGGFEMAEEEVQAPAPGGMALLEHPDGPTWPDGSVRTFSVRGKMVVPDANGRYAVLPGAVRELQEGHGFIKKIEENLGVVDAAEAEAKRDAAVQRDDALQVELDAAKKELEQLHADDGLLLRRSKELQAQDKEIEALKAERDAAVQSAEDGLGDLEKAVAKAQENARKASAIAATLEDEIAEAKKEMDALRSKTDASALKNAKELKSQAKEIAALNADIDANERQITALLNKEQVAKASKKK
jgi:hypothetical protein